MKNQSLHGGFILPIQLDNFFYSEQNRVSAVKRCRPARAVAQPQIENNIRLDAVFKKPLYIARKSLSVTATRSRCRNRRVPVECTLLTTGSTSLLKSYSLESRSHFSPESSGEIARAYALHASNSKALFLKQPGIFIKSIYYPHSSVPTILSNYFTCFDICISPSHSKPMAELCAAVLSLPVNSSKRGGIPARRSSISRATPRPRYSGRTPDLRYLGHIFVVARTIFSAERRRSRRENRPPLPSATMTTSRLFVSERGRCSSVVLPLPLNSALRRSSSPHRRPMPISPFHLSP